MSDVLWKAMLFTTGSSPTQLASVGVGLNPLTAATLPVTLQVKVSLFSVSSADPAPVPVDELTTTDLVEVEMEATQGLYTFVDTAFNINPFILAADTSYALVLASDTAQIKWGRNRNTTPTASSGFQYDGFLVSENSGGTWSTMSDTISMDNAVEIDVVPEPSTMLFLAMGAFGGLGISALRIARPRGIR